MKLKSGAIIEVFCQFKFYIAFKFFMSCVTHSEAIKFFYKKNLFFTEFRWTFHNDKFSCTVCTEWHNNGRLPTCLSCILIFRNFWDFLIILWGKETSWATVFSTEMGFQTPYMVLWQALYSSCQYLWHVIKTSDFARTIWRS